MSKFTFSREPAVYVGVIAAFLISLFTAGVVQTDDATRNAVLALIPVLAGIATRFLVTPNSSVPAAPAASAPPATPAAPSA